MRCEVWGKSRIFDFWINLESMFVCALCTYIYVFNKWIWICESSVIWRASKQLHNARNVKVKIKQTITEASLNICPLLLWHYELWEQKNWPKILYESDLSSSSRPESVEKFGPFKTRPWPLRFSQLHTLTIQLKWWWTTMKSTTITFDTILGSKFRFCHPFDWGEFVSPPKRWLWCIYMQMLSFQRCNYCDHIEVKILQSSAFRVVKTFLLNISKWNSHFCVITEEILTAAILSVVNLPANNPINEDTTPFDYDFYHFVYRKDIVFYTIGHI